MSSGEPTAAVTTAVGKDSAELREKCAQCADTQADKDRKAARALMVMVALTRWR